MALRHAEIIELYRRRAPRYNFSAQLYNLIGFRVWAYRKRVVRALGLQRGDHVVEIGCGTGINFSLLQEKIGPEGHITGVDLTDAMLAGAEEKIRRNEWSNVDLVRSSAADYVFLPGINGIVSTFAPTLMQEY